MKIISVSWPCVSIDYVHIISRSSSLQMFFKIGVLDNVEIFTGKHLSLFNKVTDIQSYGFVKKDSNTGFFLRIIRNFEERLFYRTPPVAASIVYKKTDEWYIEWQRVATSGTKSDNKWYKEWQQVVQRVTTNDNEWQRVVQQVTTKRMTTNGTKWYNEWQRVTTSDIEWREVTTSGNFGPTSFFQIIRCWYEPFFISLSHRLLQAVVMMYSKSM